MDARTLTRMELPVKLSADQGEDCVVNTLEARTRMYARTGMSSRVWRSDSDIHRREGGAHDGGL